MQICSGLFLFSQSSIPQLQILLMNHYASKLSFVQFPDSDGTESQNNPSYVHALDPLEKKPGKVFNCERNCPG